MKSTIPAFPKHCGFSRYRVVRMHADLDRRLAACLLKQRGQREG